MRRAATRSTGLTSPPGRAVAVDRRRRACEWAARLQLAAAAALPLAAGAQTPAVDSLPISVVFGIENVRLHQGEVMGLASGTLLFDVGGGWSFGPGVYGAATGDRGGLFVGGLAVQRRFALAPGWWLAAELFAGGGGGAAAPVGSGLMIRPSLSLLADLSPQWQAGVSGSWVDFPSGQIDSAQFGLVLAWRGDFLHLPLGADGSPPASPVGGATGLGFERAALTATAYRQNGGSGQTIGLVGARFETPGRDGAWRWGFEGAAAATGDAAGYMEILGTLSGSIAPFADALPQLRVGARGSVGLGGGGAVPTGGGLIGKASGLLEWRITPLWTLGAEFGGVASAEGSFRARQAQLWLAAALDPEPDAPAGPPVRTEWGGGVQYMARVARNDGGDGPVDNVTFKLNRYVGEHAYVTGQAISAFAGGVGGFSMGLLGGGFSAAAAPAVRVGAELLVGAAGGGGVTTGGGAVMQAVAWGGWEFAPSMELRLGVGGVRSFSGALSSPIAELSFVRAFGQSAR